MLDMGINASIFNFQEAGTLILDVEIAVKIDSIPTILVYLVHLLRTYNVT